MVHAGIHIACEPAQLLRMCSMMESELLARPVRTRCEGWGGEPEHEHHCGDDR
jgi:hypothetical protein